MEVEQDRVQIMGEQMGQMVLAEAAAVMMVMVVMEY
jgi:hypothetical protein